MVFGYQSVQCAYSAVKIARPLRMSSKYRINDLTMSLVFSSSPGLSLKAKNPALDQQC